MSAPKYSQIVYQEEGYRATIKLNRPDKRNALTTEMFLEILDALDCVEKQSAIKSVVLTGEGDSFCAGQDRRYSSVDVETYLRYSQVNGRTRDRLRCFPKPVVGRINGPAAGGGCLLATECCDISIASTKARFALKEVAVGLQTPPSCVFSIGRARALYMCLTTSWVSGEDAALWGLIYKAVEPEQLDAAVTEVVDQLAALPPLSLQYTKRAVNFLLRHAGFEEVEEYGREIRTHLQTTDDRLEALRAISEKRTPVFKGR